MTEILDTLKVSKLSLADINPQVDLSLNPPALKHPSHMEIGEKFENANFILDFIKSETARHEISESLMAHKLKLSSHKRELLRLSNEEMALKMKESSEAYSHASTWDWLSKIARYVMHTITMCLGIGFVATGVGVPLGCVLISAGVAGITTELLSHIGGWEWIAKQLHDDEKVQKKIAQMLPTAMHIVTIFFSVTGALGAVYIGVPSVVSQALLSWEAIQSIITGAIKIGDAGIKYEISMKKIGIDAENEIINHLEKVIEMIHNQVVSGAKGAAKGTNAANLIMRTNTALKKLHDPIIDS